jgi:hypothetical protein
MATLIATITSVLFSDVMKQAGATIITTIAALTTYCMELYIPGRYSGTVHLQQGLGGRLCMSGAAPHCAAPSRHKMMRKTNLQFYAMACGIACFGYENMRRASDGASRV